MVSVRNLLLPLSVALIPFGAPAEEPFEVEPGGSAVIYYQGGKREGEGTSGAGYTANLELTVKLKEGELYGRLHAGEGDGADGKWGEELFANLNTLADDNPENGGFELLEFYYTLELLSGNLKLYLGKSEPFILIDANRYANDEEEQFVGKAFVNNPLIDPEDRFAPMVGVDWKLSETLSFQGVLQSSDKGRLKWNGEEWENEEKSVYEDIFDRPTGALQLTYTKDNWNYRVYLWGDTAPHPKLTCIDRPEGCEGLRGVAVGLSLDGELSEGIGLFARASVARKTAYRGWQFYSVGALFNGERGELGVGLGAVVPSPYYGKQSTEVHFEGYYRVDLGENLYLMPDLQVVLNPGGDGSSGPLYAATVKLGLSF